MRTKPFFLTHFFISCSNLISLHCLRLVLLLPDFFFLNCLFYQISFASLLHPSYSSKIEYKEKGALNKTRKMYFQNTSWACMIHPINTTIFHQLPRLCLSSILHSTYPIPYCVPASQSTSRTAHISWGGSNRGSDRGDRRVQLSGNRDGRAHRCLQHSGTTISSRRRRRCETSRCRSARPMQRAEGLHPLKLCNAAVVI